MSSNSDFLIYLKDFIARKDREELKKKLKNNYYMPEEVKNGQGGKIPNNRRNDWRMWPR